MDAHAPGNLRLLLVGGVVAHDLHHEAVALRLREGVDPLGLDRILGGKDQAGVGNLPRLASDRDLALSHDLEERRLHLGWSTVYLVSKDNVGEDRTPFDV